MKKDNWKEFWDKLGTSIDPIAATDRPTVSPETYHLYSVSIKRNLALKPNDVLLDIGCGTGIIDASLAPSIRQLFATDFSQVMASKAGFITANHQNVEVVTCDSTLIPFKDGTFSKILVYAVAQYLSLTQINDLLAEAHRLTCPGGLILLGEIPRTRDTHLAKRINDVWLYEGIGGVTRKVIANSCEFWLRFTGRWTHRFIRPEGPEINLHSADELLKLVRQHDMTGRVLQQTNDFPWFHQTFDLLIRNCNEA